MIKVEVKKIENIAHVFIDSRYKNIYLSAVVSNRGRELVFLPESERGYGIVYPASHTNFIYKINDKRYYFCFNTKSGTSYKITIFFRRGKAKGEKEVWVV
ncbi:MAG TPA: hypothetical protein ENG42_03545 [Candidatus Aenigmarchaeota archaeon]|nr:MAG: hypothetical protein DRP03_01515 [Candidatus Aenigmarchaeota archaeon]HDD46526.1 hypothetical protein [Candidatus Aenigmarchaeota archaeon]